MFAHYQVDWLIAVGSVAGESEIFDALLVAAEEGETAVSHAHAGEMIIIDEHVHTRSASSIHRTRRRKS